MQHCCEGRSVHWFHSSECQAPRWSLSMWLACPPAWTWARWSPGEMDVGSAPPEGQLSRRTQDAGMMRHQLLMRPGWNRDHTKVMRSAPWQEPSDPRGIVEQQMWQTHVAITRQQINHQKTCWFWADMQLWDHLSHLVPEQSVPVDRSVSLAKPIPSRHARMLQGWRGTNKVCSAWTPGQEGVHRFNHCQKGFNQVSSWLRWFPGWLFINATESIGRHRSLNLRHTRNMGIEFLQGKHSACTHSCRNPG